jgi:hypothetical protein
MKILLPLFIFTLISFSCFKTNVEEGTVYASVNNVKLTLEEAKANIPTSEFYTDSIKAYENYKAKWIEDQLVLQEIERIDLLDSPEVHRKVERAKRQMLMISFQEAVLSSIENEIEVTDEEAQNYYQQNKDKFLLDERYIRFRHLIAESQSDAQKAKRDLMRGIEWETVAKNYSLEPDLILKNSSRFWPENSALSEYETLNRYLRLIGITEISLIENINGRFHFVQLMEERTAGEHPDLEWLLAQIKEWLILEKKRVTYNTYLKNLYLAAEANNEIGTYNVLPENFNSDIISDSLNSN